MKCRALQKIFFIIGFTCTITHRTCSIIHRLKNVSGNTPNQSYFMHETDIIDNPVTHSQANFLKAPSLSNFENLSLFLIRSKEQKCLGIWRCFLKYLLFWVSLDLLPYSPIRGKNVLPTKNFYLHLPPPKCFPHPLYHRWGDSHTFKSV